MYVLPWTTCCSQDGANACQYLAEEGDACQLKAAVLCASPWNLDVSSVQLQSTWLGLEVYSKTMGSSMKKLFETWVIYKTALRGLSNRILGTLMKSQRTPASTLKQ